MEICYKGTNYSGWQVQDNSNSIQGEIQNALTTLLKSETDIMGAGRTDAGVHGLGMVAHFDAVEIKDQNDFQYKVNSILPKDIAVRSIRPVREDAHARFDAISRSYEYRIHTRKEPFSSDDSYFFNKELDDECIEKAIEIIKSHRDFEAFSKVHTEVNHFNCDIFEASWERSASHHVFRIRADRFLRGMVRTIVGTLLDIGTKRTSIEQLQTILASKDRKLAGRAVPAHGLYFMETRYPEEIWRTENTYDL